MASTPASVPRAKREDTKTLVRLGTARETQKLSPEQRAVLRDIANEGDATGNRVQLWFKGLSAPVRARVRVSGERIWLETLLPFLELDSEVSIARNEDSSRLQARIAQVTLVAGSEQSVPRLRVEVALAGDEAPALAATAQAKTESESQRAVTLPVPARTPQSNAQPGRWLPWVAAFVLGLAGGAAGTGAWLAPWLRAPFAAPAHRRDMPSHGSDSVPAPQKIVASVVALEPLPEVTPVAEAPAQVAAEPAGAADPTNAADPAVVAEPFNAAEEANPAESFNAADPVNAADPANVADPTNTAGVAAEPSEPAAAAAQRGLEIESADDRTEIFIPMQGSAEGMERYDLTTPGVSFTLPHAHALIAASNYVVQHRPLVRRVWLRERAGGVQVRIILPRASIHDETRFDGDGLHIVLRP